MFKDNFSKLLYITKYEFFFITPYCPTFLMGATLLGGGDVQIPKASFFKKVKRKEVFYSHAQKVAVKL